jgi:hypothetical protein
MSSQQQQQQLQPKQEQPATLRNHHRQPNHRHHPSPCRITFIIAATPANMVVPLQPTEADFDQTVTNALQGLNDYAGPERIDRTYDKIIDHYCAWVDLQLANNAAPPLTGGMYTTPAVTELYFAKVVGYRADVQPNTEKRTMYGLQKLADREHIGQSERWELKSSKRIQSLLFPMSFPIHFMVC